MSKMFTLIIALVIIFSFGTCYAAAPLPVYDGDEKIFLEDFNAMAKAMSIPVLDNKITSASNGNYELKGKDLKINLTLNQAGAVEKISLSSKVKSRIAESLIVTLAVLGLSVEEFDALPNNIKDGTISIWCKAANRKIIAEKLVAKDEFGVLIEADAEP